MKDNQGTSASSPRAAAPSDTLIGGGAQATPARRVPSVPTRAAVLRVVIRPARPDDLEEATLVERRVWGRLGASLNELQRRLFALPEAFLLAELQRPVQAPRIVALANGLLWTRDFPRSYLDYERILPPLPTIRGGTSCIWRRSAWSRVSGDTGSVCG
jgi:hypothetical protein